METIRYGLIGAQDVRTGNGTFEVELADGRIITLNELSGATAPNLMILPAYTLAGLPGAGTARRLSWVTDDVRGIRVDTGVIQAPRSMANLLDFVTGGVGTAASPWTGWDAAATWIAEKAYWFPPGVYRRTAGVELLLKNGIALIGSGGNSIIEAGGDESIIGEASPGAAVSRVLIANLALDGRRASLSFPTDDADGNAIRLNQVSHSRFQNLYIHDTIFNGVSIYNISDDNIFAYNRLDDIGKTGLPPASATYNGFFLESGSNRNILAFNRINTTRENGIWENSVGSASRDNRYVVNYINNTTGDGIRVGNEDVTGAQQPLQRPKLLGNIIGGVLGTSVGVRIYHAGTGGNAGTVDYAVIADNTVTGGALHGILVDTNSVDANVHGNHALSHASGTGIRDAGTRTSIRGNHVISNNTGIAAAGTNGDVFENVLQGNTTALSETGTGYRIRHNRGYLTEASGTDSIASGTTGKTVTHGLGVTPTARDIQIVFTEQGTSDYGRWWISGITSTQFDLNVTADPGVSNLDFAWQVQVIR